LQSSATDPENDPLTYSASGLPNGLTVNASNGLISGNANTAGTFNPTITVTDVGGRSDNTSFEWTINDGLTLADTTTTPTQSGSTTSFSVTTTGGTSPTFTWNFGDGSPEVTTSSSSVDHNFTSPGRYVVTLTATDSNGNQVTTSFRQLSYPALAANSPANSQPVLTFNNGTIDLAWSVNPDQDTVSVFNLDTLARLEEIQVGESPRTIARAPDNRIWVTNKRSATISILNATTFSVVQNVSLPRGSQPHGIVFSPDGSDAWVALEATGEIARLNPVSGTLLSRHAVGDFPRHLAVDADSSKLYVSRFISPFVPGEATENVDVTLAGGFITVVETSNPGSTSSIRLQGSTETDFGGGGRGIPNYLGPAAISPAGDSAWVPSKQDNIERGSLRNGQNLDHDNTVRSVTSRIDLATETEDYQSRIDLDDSGIPSSAIYGPYGLHVFVALEASREVAVIDAYGEQELFRFDADRAPQGLALSPDGQQLLVHNFMSRTVSVHDISSLVENGISEVTLVTKLDPTQGETLAANVFRGKQLFYDARDNRLAREDYMSCASCHNDGGHDGRVWDFTGMGEGVRNTIDLRGRAGTGHGPLHWSANFDEIHDFEGQIRNFALGTGLMTTADFNATSDPLGAPKAGLSTDLDALNAYLESLNEFEDSPHRESNGDLTAEALQGKAVFAANNCAQCHSGDAFTDSPNGGFHDIGTLKSVSGQRLGSTLTGIDTPTLRGLWDGAPFLHDGSAPTLQAAISAHSGITLTSTELNQLAAYLKQIDGTEPGPGISISLPLRLQAEDFDEGPAGTAYSDTEPQNLGFEFTGLNYRNTGVDIEASLDTDGTPSVGWIEDGEWLQFTTTLAPGAYNITARAASELGTPGDVRVYIDGTLVTTIDTQPTGGWYNWQNFTSSNVTITADGQSVVRLEFTADSFNLNWVEFDAADGGGPGPNPDPDPDPDPGQSPFGGTATTIPGKIEAENYDNGGPDVAYSDVEEENIGELYRGDGVDIERSQDADNGFSVGWIESGEWIEYTVDVTPGTYDIVARVASDFFAPGSIRVLIDGELLGTINAPGTSGWYNWQDAALQGVSISQSGTAVLRLEVLGGLYNLNWVDFVSSTGGPGPDPGDGQAPFLGSHWPLPGRVQAEDYDEGGSGIAYQDNDPLVNLGGSYRADGVDIEDSGDTDNSPSLGWFDSNEWVEYSVDVTPGTYTIRTRVSSAEDDPGDLRVLLDGTELTVVPVNSTGDWTNWVSVVIPDIVISQSGNAILRVETIGDAINFNWIDFELTSTVAATSITLGGGSFPNGTGDADFDGVTDMIEFAFGSDMTSADDAFRPMVSTVEESGVTYPAMSFRVLSGGTFTADGYEVIGITYTPEAAQDMSNWTEALTRIDNPSSLPVPPSGYKYVTYRLNTPAACAFFRVEIRQ
ncbi:MAG: carbohydrate-binding protein, partial [Verrucomicrobiota bacterium]